jgi:hypothetical protein
MVQHIHGAAHTWCTYMVHIHGAAHTWCTYMVHIHGAAQQNQQHRYLLSAVGCSSLPQLITDSAVLHSPAMQQVPATSSSCLFPYTQTSAATSHSRHTIQPPARRVALPIRPFRVRAIRTTWPRPRPWRCARPARPWVPPAAAARQQLSGSMHGCGRCSGVADAGEALCTPWLLQQQAGAVSVQIK